MKKSKVARGYFLNTVVIILLFTAFQILTSAKGSQGSFKLVLIPSIWQCCYLMVLAASLNLVLGFMGQLSLGHCGFMAIGAYTAALLSLACERAELFEGKSDPAFILVLFSSVIAAGLMAAVLSLLVGIPALRLKGDYLAIITLGFGMSADRTVWRWDLPVLRFIKTVSGSEVRQKCSLSGLRSWSLLFHLP